MIETAAEAPGVNPLVLIDALFATGCEEVEDDGEDEGDGDGDDDGDDE